MLLLELSCNRLERKRKAKSEETRHLEQNNQARGTRRALPDADFCADDKPDELTKCSLISCCDARDRRPMVARKSLSKLDRLDSCIRIPL